MNIFQCIGLYQLENSINLEVSLFRLVLIMCLLLPIVLVAPHSAAQSDAFEVILCPSNIAIPSGYDVECGYLTVPENRADSDNMNTIRNFVVIVHARSDNPIPDPLVYLSGGPGGRVTRLLPVFNFLFGGFAESRDVVLMDQRGTGFSEPRLDCPGFSLAVYDGLALYEDLDEAIDQAADLMLECRQEYEEAGYDVTAYNSRENAADFEDLRQALGYDEWNIYGISYGSRLALTILRDFPEGARSAVIDGVVPPAQQLYLETPNNGIGAYGVLFESCASDPDCSELYPDLERVFYETVQILDENPVEITVRRPSDGQSYEATLDGDFFAGSFFFSLYSSQVIGNLPYVIYSARAGNYRPLIDQVLPSYFIWDGIDVGMHYSVNCAEEIAFNTREEIEGATLEIDEDIRHFFDFDGLVTWEICEEWGAVLPDSVENEPVLSDVPTLIFSGENDPITPPHWAQNASEYLSNHHLFVVPGGGHGVTFSYTCAQFVVRDFIDDPNGEPDSSCIDSLDTGPDFQLSPVEIPE